jgi:hypothetical protein
MTENRKEEKTGVQKLRERFYRIKESIRPSDELKKALQKDKERYERNNQPEKKIAKQNRPHEADV